MSHNAVIDHISYHQAASLTIMQIIVVAPSHKGEGWGGDKAEFEVKQGQE
jgi:hypothetical protein